MLQLKPLYHFPASCLNVIVFLGFWVFTFCSLHHLTAAGKRGSYHNWRLVALTVCCSLLQRDFVFRIIESSDLRKRILSAQALPFSFKAFYKLQFIKHNNRLRSVVRPLQREGPRPPTPPSFFLCSRPQQAGWGGMRVLPVGGHPWPSAQACLSLPPCQGSTLHLPIGNTIFPPPGCICLPFTKQSTHIFFPLCK